MLDILRLTVRGAAGSGWESALKEALRQVEGVVGVTGVVQGETHRHHVRREQDLPSALQARVEKLGYEVDTLNRRS